jgi:hypothetical protein
MDTKMMEYAISVDLPDVVLVDHILALRLERGASNESYAIGQAAYAIRDMSIKYNFMAVMFGQLNQKDSVEFLNTGTLPQATFFGSSMVGQSINLGLLTKRDSLKPQVQYFLKKKNSVVISGGEIDQTYYLGFDSSRASYVDVQLEERIIE